MCGLQPTVVEDGQKYLTPSDTRRMENVSEGVGAPTRRKEVKFLVGARPDYSF